MKTCAVAGCDLPVKTRGWCNAHYLRWWRNGHLGEPEVQGPRQACDVTGCDRLSDAKGYCGAHYRRWRRTGDAGAPDLRGPAETYVGIHLKVARDRGPATSHTCSLCGHPANDWAYDHRDPNERYRPEYGSPYSLDVSHYTPLCRGCHIDFDSCRQPAAGPRAQARAQGEAHVQ